MDRARAADLRADRRHRELLLHRAVVSEARRSRGRGLELSPVPLEHGVLFRLRRLRRAADRAARLDRRRHRRPARPPRQRGRHDDPSYYQEDVHDFAWTTSPDYVERTARFEHPTLPPVTMRLLLQPEHRGQADRHFDATRTTLKHYGEWFGPYPYGHLTIVDPAYQSDADGMEYPTLFTAGTRWLLPREVTSSGRRKSSSTKPATSGGTAWSATTSSRMPGSTKGSIPSPPRARSNRTIRGPTAERYFFGDFVPWVFRDVWLRRETFWNRLPGYRPGREERCPRRCRPIVSIPRPDAHHLQQDRVVAEYAGAPARLGDAAAHPPDVLFALAVQASEAGGLLRRRQRGRRHQPRLVLRPGVSELERVRLRRSGSQERRGRPTGSGRPSSCAVTARRSSRSTCSSHSRTASRSGALGRPRSLEAVHLRPSNRRPLSAQVDPDRVLLLDVNYTNNSKIARASRGDRRPTKWSLKWMVWLQDALLSWAFLA